MTLMTSAVIQQQLWRPLHKTSSKLFWRVDQVLALVQSFPRGVLWRRPQWYSAMRHVALLPRWVRELYCHTSYNVFNFISLKCSTLFNSFLVQRTSVFHATLIFLVKNMLHFLVCRLFHANLTFQFRSCTVTEGKVWKKDSIQTLHTITTWINNWHYWLQWWCHTFCNTRADI